MVRESVVRVQEKTHRNVKVAAALTNSMISEFVEEAVEEKIEREPQLESILSDGEEEDV